MSDRTHTLSRRGFLGQAAAGAAAVAAGRPVLAAQTEGEAIPVGIQLWSVRGECKKDFAKTIEALGEMGYDGVEFAGTYGWKAADLKKLLDDSGLRCCGTHTGLGSLTGGNLKKTIAYNQASANPYLIVPGMPGQYRKKGKDGWVEAAKVFSQVASTLKPRGMHCGYHNHTHEFKPLDGTTPWDAFFGAASEDVIMQLDIGHCKNGGADPAAVIRKYPGRAVTVHVRESGGDGVVGAGAVDWKAVFGACSTVGGTEWYIVEFGGSKHGVFECARRSLANVRRMTT
ncbi:MAG: sugar phosphate isomerase/epimerase family protein [Planctomycetota bacterium]